MTQPPGGDRHQARPLRRRPRKRDAPGAPGDQESYELTEEDREWARRTVASLPPLTDRQRDILALLLRNRR